MAFVWATVRHPANAKAGPKRLGNARSREIRARFEAVRTLLNGALMRPHPEVS